MLFYKKDLAITASSLWISAGALAFGPDNVEIDSIVWAGSGCPAGSVSSNVSDDNQAFTLLFDEYIAEIGPFVSKREKRKNCTINIDLSYPQGWSFSIFKVDYRGFASLDRGVKGTQKSTYYFQGSSNSISMQSNFYGPTDEDYVASDSLGLSALVWSPCGENRSLNINSQVRLDNRRNVNGSGIMTLDSIDGNIKQIYHIKWKRCL